MKNKILLLALPCLAISFTAQARPYPDEVGVCYIFNGNDIKQKAPCIISSGYGAGAMYTIFSLGNHDYSIEMSTISNPNGEYDLKLNGVDADDYYRYASSLKKIISINDLNNNDILKLSCYKTKRTDICYKEKK